MSPGKRFVSQGNVVIFIAFVLSLVAWGLTREKMNQESTWVVGFHKVREGGWWSSST